MSNNRSELPYKIGKWSLLGLLAIGMTLLVVQSAIAQNTKSYSSEVFDVDITVNEGGSILVHEKVTFDFAGGPFSYVFRELPIDKTDGITKIVASKNGSVLPEGTSPGEVEITGKNPIVVTWHMEPTWDRSIDFDLQSKVSGVVEQTSDGDSLTWKALPESYDYSIDMSSVSVNYPTSINLLTEPAILGGDAQIESFPGTVTFQANNLFANDPLIISLLFPQGSLISSPPNWQAREARIKDLAWVWIVSSIFIVGIGVAAALIVSKPYRKMKLAKGLIFEPLAEDPPAYVGALHSGATTISWNHALGTLFDLANRGLITIIEIPKKGWLSGRDFALRRTDLLPVLLSHEDALLELLFMNKKGERQSEVRLSKVGQLVTSRRWKLFTKALDGELESGELIDLQRKDLRRKWIIVSSASGIFVLVLGILLALVLNSTLGFWPLTVVGSLFLISLVWVIAGSSISILSDTGRQAADQWELFYRYLRDVSKGKRAIADPTKFETFLPYAATFGLLSSWVKQFEKQGWQELPGYFLALEGAGDNHMAVFVAMTAATASSGGSAAGASAAAGAGASAAGGGASGAG